jgi:protein ImuB
MPRMVVVWCPDWPVVAAGAPPGSLTAVVHANRVVACSPAARAEGVRPGLRRREAQSRCPELELLAHDPARDARAFEPVLVAVEQLTPWVEVLQPGECAFPARGAARYHGGEPALAVTVTAAVHAAIGGRVACQVGIADGTFTASLAARRAATEGAPGAAGWVANRVGSGSSSAGAGLGAGGAGVGVAFADAGLAGGHQAIVPPGGSRAFLAPLPVATLDRPDLADLLVRLGLRTLGDLAALPRADLATRFGPEGARAARLAGGLDEHPRGARRPPPDLLVAAELDPPADRVDTAAFAAKALADELAARLDRLGLACTRLRIEAGTDQGETLSRVWRYDPAAPPPRSSSGPDPVPRSASAAPQAPGGGPGRRAAVMAERVRWQLDGWLTGRTGRLPGALTHLALAPDEVVPDRGRQLGFWGGETETARRAARALARIQGLLGPEAVHTPRLRGGRDPAARVTLTPTPDLPSSPLLTLPSAPSPSTPPPPISPRSISPSPIPPPSDPRAAGPSAPDTAAAPVPGASGPPRRGWVSAQVPDVPGLPRRTGLAGSLPLDPSGASGQDPAGVPGAVPWPGQVPAPAPAVVYAEPLPAEVVDTAGATVAVDGRGLLGSLPSRVRIRGRAWSAITAWAGPWLVDERWWDPAAHRRLVRLQATTDQGAAYLLRLAGGHWWVEAIYD